jgi:hypothetical protein
VDTGVLRVIPSKIVDILRSSGMNNQLKNMLPWSREDFECLKLKMLIKYPAPLSLWNELKRNAERFE